MTLITNPAPSALRDPSGSFIPPGTLHKSYAHNPTFAGEAVPEWITAGSGTTISPSAESAPFPCFEIATEVGNTNAALGPDTSRTPYLAASAITLRGVMSLNPVGGVNSSGHHMISLSLTSAGSNSEARGASLISNGQVSSTQEGATVLRGYRDGNIVEKRSIHRYSDPASPGGVFRGVTMSLLVHWQLSMVYAFEGDFMTGDCVNILSAEGIMSYSDDDPIRPRLTIGHNGGSGALPPAPLRIGGVQVDHWFY